MKVISFLMIMYLSFASLNTSAHCFQQRMVEYSNNIEYFSTTSILKKEGSFYFLIQDNRIVVDSTKGTEDIDYFVDVIEVLLNIQLCDSFPHNFQVQFKQGDKNSIAFYDNYKVIITKKNKFYESTPAKKDYYYNQDSRISVQRKLKGYSAKVVRGKKIVFEYIFKHKENPHFSDDEVYEVIYFQIPFSEETFIYKGKKVKKTRLFYERVCFGNCYGKFIYEGLIKGWKNDSHWVIEIQFEDIHIKEIFKRKAELARPEMSLDEN